MSPSFHGKQRYIGIFGCKDEATIVLQTARKVLRTEDGPKPEKDEIEKRIKLAREAALSALRKVKPGDSASTLNHELGPCRKNHEALSDQKLEAALPGKKAFINYRMTGVRQTPSKKWVSGLCDSCNVRPSLRHSFCHKYLYLPNFHHYLSTGGQHVLPRTTL